MHTHTYTRACRILLEAQRGVGNKWHTYAHTHPHTPTHACRILLEAQRGVGNKWSEIAKMLPGRAENAVKNR